MTNHLRALQMHVFCAASFFALLTMLVAPCSSLLGAAPLLGASSAPRACGAATAPPQLRKGSALLCALCTAAAQLAALIAPTLWASLALPFPPRRGRRLRAWGGRPRVSLLLLALFGKGVSGDTFSTATCPTFRYVRVANPMVQIAELQVFSGGTNVALNKASTSSTTLCTTCAQGAWDSCPGAQGYGPASYGR